MIRSGLGLLRSAVIYGRPWRQPGLRALYAPFVGPGDLVFDIGAHLGDRTRAFRALGARVVALEPQPALLRRLERTFGGADGVHVVGAAAGAAPGWAEMATSAAHPSVSTLAHGWRERIARENPGFRGVRWEGRVRVPVTTLDALVAAHGLPRFCKIDVEGYEPEVLAGLGHPVEALSVEFVAGGLDGTLACVRRLGDLGDYTFNAIQGEGRRFLFPGWRSAPEIEEWIRAGAGGAPSGDLYARLSRVGRGA